MEVVVFSLRPLLAGDLDDVVAVFNYYIENSFAAYREEPVTGELVAEYVRQKNDLPGVAVCKGKRKFVGFAFFRPHKPLPTFSHSVDFICFLLPEATGCGVGRTVLKYLEHECTGMGVRNIFSSISSKNRASIKFHLKNGFVECGRFREAGRKNGEFFDVVWMQKRVG